MYGEGIGYIVDEWYGWFDPQENFKKSLEKIANLIRERWCTLQLANLSELKGSFDNSSKWLTSVIMPEVVDTDLKHEAVALQKNILTKLSAKDTVNKINAQGLTVKYFENFEEGET